MVQVALVGPVVQLRQETPVRQVMLVAAVAAAVAAADMDRSIAVLVLVEPPVQQVPPPE
jgi:hypothetical protein